VPRTGRIPESDCRDREMAAVPLVPR
jgi:hypothetical protein